MRRSQFLMGVPVIALLLFGVLVSAGARAEQSACGTDRWDVKTLTDSDTGDVDLTQVIGVNISTLASLPPPTTLPDQYRYNPYETTIYTATADLVEAQLQPDHDIVVVLKDPITGDTMTAHLPDAAQCASGAAPAFLQLMEQARSSFIEEFGTPSTTGFTPLSGLAQVTGVGFLDPVQGQHGEAPNGFELHPVLEFRTAHQAAALSASGGGAPASSPAAAATAGPPTPTPTATSTPAAGAPPRYYADTSGNATIYCDTDPALLRAGRRWLVSFRSLDLALAEFPAFHLNRPC